MNRLLRNLLFAAPAALSSFGAWSQNEPVIVEAESGLVGAEFDTLSAGGVTYVGLVNKALVSGAFPGSADRVLGYTVTFPQAGVYQLYGRMRVGPQTFNDDSFFVPNSLGAKDAANGADWTIANGLAGNVGYTSPADTVVGGGLAASNVWKWVQLTAFAGRQYVVAEGALTQTFQVGGREDGLNFDKFAFGREGVFYKVSDLDAGLPGTTVPPPPPFDPTGPPMATGKEKWVGGAWSNAQSPNFADYFNQVTPENGGKWASVEQTRDVMNWGDLDNAYNLAKANGFPFRFHVLVWGNQQPQWIESLPPAEQLEEIEEWFAAVAARYPDIDFLEVVNEPISDPPSGPGNGNYIGALGGTGETGWDWILNAFRMARLYFPDTPLGINEYSVENETNKALRYIEIIELLQDEDLIDFIGVQGHAFSTRGPVSQLIGNLDMMGATGLPIQITELDIDGPTDAIQLADYKRIFPAFYEHPSVVGITLWGYRVGHWRTAQGAYLAFDNGAERPALVWLQEYVRNNAPVVDADQFFTVSEAAADGAAVGTAAATDADEDAVLGSWAIVGGTGAAIFEIDAATGAISVADATQLDFETTDWYTLELVVRDEYTGSAAQAVAIEVLNLNDNPPLVLAGQSFDIDGGCGNAIGTVQAEDPDDANDPGFTDFQGWKIVGGTAAKAFGINANTGALQLKAPLIFNFRQASSTLQVRVGDSQYLSPTATVTIKVPAKVEIRIFGRKVMAPRAAVPLLILFGGQLGDCSS